MGYITSFPLVLISDSGLHLEKVLLDHFDKVPVPFTHMVWVVVGPADDAYLQKFAVLFAKKLKLKDIDVVVSHVSAGSQVEYNTDRQNVDVYDTVTGITKSYSFTVCLNINGTNKSSLRVEAYSRLGYRLTMISIEALEKVLFSFTDVDSAKDIFAWKNFGNTLVTTKRLVGLGILTAGIATLASALRYRR